MFIKQIYTSCLAQASYYIESNGCAAIIDPIRDTHIYTELAHERNATIQYIFETHFHADFVSGHQDLAHISGVPILFGPGAQTQFDSIAVSDNQIFKLGHVTIKILHTPGHTPESMCLLLSDENGQPHSLFTGDTLFIGDVGRPDLLGGDYTPELLAGLLYDSLQTKIKTLPGDIIIYPGHGAGSACGKNIGTETSDTLNNQLKYNYALGNLDKETFIQILTDDIPPAPDYFSKNAHLNKSGVTSLNQILQIGNKPIAPEELKSHQDRGAYIIDTRNTADFEGGFIPGSVNISLDGQFAVWAANILSLDTPIIFVCEPGKEIESITRLARVGFSNIQGYVAGGFEAWKNAGNTVDMVISIEPEELALDIRHSENMKVIDVRRQGEYKAGHVAGALNLELSFLINSVKGLDKKSEYLIYCGGGYRSMVASSILKKNGFHLIKNVHGGFSAITKLEDIIIEN